MRQNQQDPTNGALCDAKARIAELEAEVARLRADAGSFVDRICEAVKDADDRAMDTDNYMLDSKDCIKVIRGQWHPKESGNG